MYRFAKRAFDFLLAAALLLLTAPLMLAIAAAVRLTSRGPALYWADRLTRGNRVFQMPKFRTMRIDAPVLPRAELEDPRRWLTPIGRFLRRTSLDELPQLWSILTGAMSFVGPRPALYNQFDLIRMRVARGIDALTPGLTGWAQVNGRDEIDDVEKVRYEVEYLHRCSLALDLRILLMTAGQVVRSQGVERLPPSTARPANVRPQPSVRRAA